MRMLLRNYVSFRRQIVRAPASDLMTTLFSFLIKSAHGSVFADAYTHVLPNYLSEDGRERDREKECNDNRIGQAFCPAGHNPLFPSLFASSLVAAAALESRRRAKERESLKGKGVLTTRDRRREATREQKQERRAEKICNKTSA